MFIVVCVVGILNILCVRYTDIRRSLLLVHPRPVAILYSEYLCLGPVCLADRCVLFHLLFHAGQIDRFVKSER